MSGEVRGVFTIHPEKVTVKLPSFSQFFAPNPDHNFATTHSQADFRGRKALRRAKRRTGRAFLGMMGVMCNLEIIWIIWDHYNILTFKERNMKHLWFWHHQFWQIAEQKALPWSGREPANPITMGRTPCPKGDLHQPFAYPPVSSNVACWKTHHLVRCFSKL